MPNMQGAPLEEQVKVLLEQNLAYSKEIYHISKKIHRYILWGRVMSIISLLVFVILPVILSVIYLPNIINNLTGKLLPGIGGQAGALNGVLQGYGLNQSDLLQMIQDQGGPLKAYQQLLDQNN